jgi:phosphonate transport system substrate-binding protein
MKTILKRSILLILLLLFCTPCSLYAQPSQQKVLIGILPEMNVFKQKQRFKLLGEYLTHKIGRTVEFTILSRYGNIIERFTAEKMDGAFFGSFTGALAIRKLGVIPLARPVNLDQTSTYHGYLFVRKDSGIRGVQDMKGKKMAFVEKATTAGYIFPLAYLRENGITDIDHFFSESLFTGSHDAAIHVVLEGKADVGAAKHSIYDRVRREEPRVDRELVILAESPRVPSNGLCVRKGLDPVLKEKMKDALLKLHDDAEGDRVLNQFGAIKFIETTVQDYQPVFDMATKAGIDIKTYDYRNK